MALNAQRFFLDDILFTKVLTIELAGFFPLLLRREIGLDPISIITSLVIQILIIHLHNETTLSFVSVQN